MKAAYSALSARLWLLFCIALVVIPLAVIMAALGEFDAEIWAFLLDYQLPELVKNTLFLVFGVGVGVAFLGTSGAWLTTMYEFPLRRFFFWALMLPLAVPAYVLAFTQLGLFDYTGVINTWLRNAYGIEQALPEVRNGFGLVLVMSLTFYPYVYLLARNAFASMGQRALEAGASLGLSPARAFVKVALPMARPWIAGGVILALMETLADFGTVSVFGYDTFTTAIYQAWFDFFSLETAKQLAALLVTAVFVLLALEQLSRGRRRFHQAGKAQRQRRKALSGHMKWLATAYCGLILAAAFFIPLLQLLWWATIPGTTASTPLYGCTPGILLPLRCWPRWRWRRWRSCWLWPSAPTKAALPPWPHASPRWAMPFPARCWRWACLCRWLGSTIF